MSEVETQVKQIVVDHLGIDDSKVTSESKFIDDLGADSLDTVELVMAFEEKFGIEIPDDEVEIQVKQIVVDHLGIDNSKVNPESKFIDDLGADSLDTVELVMAFEEKFGIEIPDDAAETIQTVQNAIDYIESKK